MRYLSLFTGVGGGDLAFQYLLGWECIGYVEWDQYCQRIIAQRIADGIFDAVPIFGDVREFVQSGAAAEYRGVADVVTGGFPCQPFSLAGKQRGADDPRNMWPATLDCIRTIRPRFAFLENVAGLLASGYFGTILGDLAESGYDARWRILSAAEVGAPHKRDRLWIVAHRGGVNFRPQHDGRGAERERGAAFAWRGDFVGRGSLADGNKRRPYVFGQRPGHVAHTAQRENHGRKRGNLASKAEGRQGFNATAVAGRKNVPNATGSGRQRPADTAGETGRLGAESISWWKAEPDVGRVVDGVADRTNRLKAIGNGIVPAVAATAWHLLTEAL